MKIMKKILIFFADGFEEIEGLTVVDLCRRAKLDISTVSITDSNTVVSSHKIELKTDYTINQVNFDEADMIVLPGGIPGTPNLEACSLLIENVVKFNEQGKMLAAICAAPSILGHLGILKGKEAICYPGFEEELEGATIKNVKSVTSGNVITACGMGGAIDFGLDIVAHYQGQQAADDLAVKIRQVID